MSTDAGRRVLVIDDTQAIHADYKKILEPSATAPVELDTLASALFGAASVPAPSVTSSVALACAQQGEEGVDLCKRALQRGERFGLAFVDMRMPPGWDGLRTIAELWKIDPALEVVLCSAYSDHPYEEIVRELGATDRLLILKKPFDSIEIVQLVKSLGAKWDLEREREAHIQNLSREVAERTRELSERVKELASTNTKLGEAVRATEVASRARDEFLTVVTHELRTPLTAILGYAELIADAHASPEIDEHARILRTNGEHLLTLINDVLDLSRIEAGAMPIEMLPCSPRAIAEDVGALLGPRARAKGLDFAVRAQSGFPECIVTDPTRLRQILINLAGNAIKFTEQGGVELALGFDERAGTIAAAVRDTGIGLSAEQRARLFQPFTQADATTARRFGGTGLGLSITHRLAELLGGTIDVESELGRGSTFRVELPLSRGAPGVAPALPTLSASVPDPSKRPLEGARVLVVDDARDVQKLVRTFLERAGATVEVALDGVAGLAAARAGEANIDLLLLDMMMPGLDGYDVARKLRAEGFRRPIVAMTAHATRGDLPECLEAGCDVSIGKPVDRARLIERCVELLARAAAKRA
ncbi:MAG: response regulator [Planctomycetes bacterium]|nr:response regulator [Planctomycetota bacterium]